MARHAAVYNAPAQVAAAAPAPFLSPPRGAGGMDGDESDVLGTVRAFFEVGRTKDLAALRGLQLDDPAFSSFGDVPPYDLKDYSTTVALEELRFVSISDYSYRIDAPKVSIVGDAAVAAFGLVQSGMLVDNKAFTGKHVTFAGRATFVLVRRGGRWRILHMHMSQVPAD